MDLVVDYEEMAVARAKITSIREALGELSSQTPPNDLGYASLISGLATFSRDGSEKIAELESRHGDLSKAITSAEAQFRAADDQAARSYELLDGVAGGTGTVRAQ